MIFATRRIESISWLSITSNEFYKYSMASASAGAIFLYLCLCGAKAKKSDVAML